MPKMPTGPANRLLPALRRVVLVRETADRTDGQLLTAFIHERDADAFAVLVRRHGPMVLGVARRVIGDSHTADDAFQAVFLVLARRAGAVRPREQVGNWLYGVAFRTAMKARAVLARRRSREKQVDAMPEPASNTRGLTALGSPDWSDLQPLIDEELARLPDKLRLPVVLCDLEGRPQRAVAKQLGVAPATLAARLASARRLLAGRLGRRGVCLSGGALAVVLGERASAAMVAPTLADSTVKAAEVIAAGTGTAGLTGLVSAHAIQLCEGVMRMMLLTKLKTAAITALVAIAFTGGLGFGLLPAQAGDEPAPVVQAKKQEPRAVRSAKSSEPITDPEFLRRLTLDLTGAVPSLIEMDYFTCDADAKKRAKVIDWMIADEGVKAAIAKKLGVPLENIQIVRAADDAGNSFKLAVVRSKKEARRTALEVFRFTDNDKPNNTVDAAVARVWESTSGKLITNAVNDNLVKEWTIDLTQNNPNQTWNQYLIWDAEQPPVGNGVQDFLYWVGQPPTNGSYEINVRSLGESDAGFLERALQAARGTAPTPLEAKYFAEDKDPKKREKLLDLLLKDPAVAKILGDEWKKKMLEPKAQVADPSLSAYRVYLGTPGYRNAMPNTAYWTPVALPPSKFEKLVDELLAAKKTDEQMLEAIALAAASRLPTAEEKKATLAVIGTLTDKKAAWVAIAKAMGK